MSRVSTSLAIAALAALPLSAVLMERAFGAPPVPALPFGAMAPALGPDEIDVASQAARDELARWTRERDEAMYEAIDPGELAEHARRAQQDQLEQRGTPPEQIFVMGETIFDRRFTRAEGLGVGDAPHSRVERHAALGGPDAVSCRECHGRGGDDGHGELHQRAWLDGDGRHLSSARPRLAPHLAGVGLVQALAAEMSADLQRDLTNARAAGTSGASDVRMPLSSKGVSFGTVVAHADGTLDASGVTGVDADLVVRPFGWKGAHASLRSFLRGALPQHMGLEPLPQRDGDKPFALIERQSYRYDRDGDGVAAEVSEGQLTALAIYLALVDVPIIVPPRAPDGYAAWSRGAALFEQLGCASCHRPSLVLQSARWSERAEGRSNAIAIDLIADNQVRPRLEQADPTSGFAVRIFSDLRRHDMGSRLAERAEGSVTPTEFLTRPLWGLGDRGTYYLHDGRARSLREAILLHGGEAADASRAYAALDATKARELDVFLMSLRRAPQGRIAP